MDFQAPLRQVKGVGEKTEYLFQKLGVYTIGDILLYFPRTYLEYPQTSPVRQEDVGELVALMGCLKTPAITRKGKRMEVTTATVFCEREVVECVWFRMPYLSSQLKVGEPVVLYGKLLQEGKRYKLEQPTVYTPEKYESLRRSYQPVYPLTKGVNHTLIRKILQEIFCEMSEADRERDGFLPPEIIGREQFPSYYQAIHDLHFPEDFDTLALARNRLVYQEFFYFILHSRMQQLQATGVANVWTFADTPVVDEVIARLPFELTAGQQETLGEIRRDLRGPVITQRLIQGDVGSGKTIVAFLAMLDAVNSGYQAAIMAPTEVLAMQHYTDFCEMCSRYGLPFECVCLVGSMTAKAKRQVYDKIRTTPGLLIVGTHALIQDKVEYGDLALVVTDEQHRFGVKQRETLSQKGKEPHVLVMSATPIPRTLAMILYGNMQISAIRGMPAKRLPIKTCVVKENMRRQSYQMIGGELKKGHQAYIICPLVEASETTEAENVSDYVEKIRKVFGPKVIIQGLHGKMPAKDKNSIMDAFAAGDIQILVSTTVVEVGINVPNATVILIEDANRFGLAQLHQLRGRVGRGQWQSYCILMDKSKGDKVTKRLEVMNQSNDGFYIAEEDLKLRGPGDFFGIRQSGDLNFKLADIIGDAPYLRMASEDVQTLLREDANLQEHPMILDKLNDFVAENSYIL
jgi:ATP-dependent DNA helicase RecG